MPGHGYKEHDWQQKDFGNIEPFWSFSELYTAEELETTLATNISTTDVSTPDGLNRRPGHVGRMEFPDNR